MQKVLAMSKFSAEVSGRRRAYSVVKRLFDIVVSLLMIVVLLPIGALVALIAAIDTKGNPFFVQVRMGRNNRPFKMVKFRTMSVNAPANVATYQLEHPETYISAVGGTLRKLSVDELPQLFNILKGDMSFIGPRPVVLSETVLLDLRSKNGASAVRPGLTGLAQINGRDDVPVFEKAQFDGQYARSLSLREDMRILFKTVGYVLHSRGVTEGANPTVAAVSKSERSA